MGGVLIDERSAQTFRDQLERHRRAKVDNHRRKTHAVPGFGDGISNCKLHMICGQDMPRSARATETNMGHG